jgi:hypothetical protein
LKYLAIFDSKLSLAELEVALSDHKVQLSYPIIYRYTFQVRPTPDAPKSVETLFVVMMPVCEMLFTQEKFEMFRTELAQFNLEIFEISRGIYVDEEEIS